MANVLSVLYMHCHYYVDCNKTLKGWTHSKWARGEHLGPRESSHRIPREFQSRIKNMSVSMQLWAAVSSFHHFGYLQLAAHFPLHVFTWLLLYTMIGYVKKKLQLFLKCIAVQYMIDAVQTATWYLVKHKHRMGSIIPTAKCWHGQVYLVEETLFCSSHSLRHCSIKQ